MNYVTRYKFTSRDDVCLAMTYLSVSTIYIYTHARGAVRTGVRQSRVPCTACSLQVVQKDRRAVLAHYAAVDLSADPFLSCLHSSNRGLSSPTSTLGVTDTTC